MADIFEFVDTPDLPLILMSQAECQNFIDNVARVLANREVYELDPVSSQVYWATFYVISITHMLDQPQRCYKMTFL